MRHVVRQALEELEEDILLATEKYNTTKIYYAQNSLVSLDDSDLFVIRYSMIVGYRCMPIKTSRIDGDLPV